MYQAYLIQTWHINKEFQEPTEKYYNKDYIYYVITVINSLLLSTIILWSSVGKRKYITIALDKDIISTKTSQLDWENDYTEFQPQLVAFAKKKKKICVPQAFGGNSSPKDRNVYTTVIRYYCFSWLFLFRAVETFFIDKHTTCVDNENPAHLFFDGLE
ncbi:hypothetical protein BDC45DRAFT_534577 [Circinella umbellata]|nr:hypothetical protein BDC45DRAFT_534577 [Circinella umbellata]